MFDKLFDRLKPAMYNYKDNQALGLNSSKKYIGVMAQDILDGLSQEGFNPSDFSIVQEKDGFYQVDYVQLIPILISRIQTLEKTVAELSSK